MLSLQDSRALAAMYPVLSSKHAEQVVLPQMEQRSVLAQYWNIEPGERVLEIGCGQGDTTLVLAAAVGELGHVTALDPASLDYGAPFTLGQAQAHLKSSPVGTRMTFVQQDPLAFLAQTTETYTSAVLSLCIWYISSPEYLGQLFHALASRVSRICIAEYALTASDPRSTPHVLAALAQAALECHKPVSSSNIRTVLSHPAICDAAVEGGFVLNREHIMTPVEGMLDGSWEVGAVMAGEWLDAVHADMKDQREKAVVIAMRDAVKANLDILEIKEQRVRTMDIWASVFDSKVKST